MRVIVQGRLKSRSYETRDGDRRTVFEIDVDEVGPALKYATAKVTKTTSGSGNYNRGGGDNYGGGQDRNYGGGQDRNYGGGQGYGQSGQQGYGGGGGGQAPAGDAWGSPPQPPADPWANAGSDEPPF
jgi:single-strand DNA-binding protein